MPEIIQTNAPEVAAELTAVADQLANPRSTLERVAQLLARQEEEVFSTSGAAIGTSWAPAVDPGGDRLLVLTGALMSSVTSPSAAEIDGDRLAFGTDVPYGQYLQAGTSKMVARPFLGVTPQTAQLVDELLAQTVASFGEGA